mmetsp:Transcript_1688/g.1790  ORF Transcript_1688/g.1790 Transcript_1688/m.1790 type:complete len:105 (-) Transcript_1688:148-462(-)
MALILCDGSSNKITKHLSMFGLLLTKRKLSSYRSKELYDISSCLYQDIEFLSLLRTKSSCLITYICSLIFMCKLIVKNQKIFLLLLWYFCILSNLCNIQILRSW